MPSTFYVFSHHGYFSRKCLGDSVLRVISGRFNDLTSKERLVAGKVKVINYLMKLLLGSCFLNFEGLIPNCFWKIFEKYFGSETPTLNAISLIFKSLSFYQLSCIFQPDGLDKFVWSLSQECSKLLKKQSSTDSKFFDKTWYSKTLRIQVNFHGLHSRLDKLIIGRGAEGSADA